jgi:hypothetical protein
MPQHDAYVLHIWRSRAVSGWQWAARLEYLPGGESVRFTAPEALLAHLQALVRRIDDGEAPDIPAGTDDPATAPEEGGRGEEA